MDESILDVDQVENLIKFCPTKEEMELLKVKQWWKSYSFLCSIGYFFPWTDVLCCVDVFWVYLSTCFLSSFSLRIMISVCVFRPIPEIRRPWESANRSVNYSVFIIWHCFCNFEHFSVWMWILEWVFFLISWWEIVHLCL